jgi:hypothetical protein
MVWPNHRLPHLWHSMEPSANSVSTLNNVPSSFIDQEKGMLPLLLLRVGGILHLLVGVRSLPLLIGVRSLPFLIGVRSFPLLSSRV